jgi:hypothetical protein
MEEQLAFDDSRVYEIEEMQNTQKKGELDAARDV